MSVRLPGFYFVSLLALVAYTSDSPSSGFKKAFGVLKNTSSAHELLTTTEIGSRHIRLTIGPKALLCTGSFELESGDVIVFGPISACFA